jgi:hypothetical protein
VDEDLLGAVAEALAGLLEAHQADGLGDGRGVAAALEDEVVPYLAACLPEAEARQAVFAVLRPLEVGSADGAADGAARVRVSSERFPHLSGDYVAVAADQGQATAKATHDGKPVFFNAEPHALFLNWVADGGRWVVATEVGSDDAMAFVDAHGRWFVGDGEGWHEATDLRCCKLQDKNTSQHLEWAWCAHEGAATALHACDTSAPPTYTDWCVCVCVSLFAALPAAIGPSLGLRSATRSLSTPLASPCLS